MSKLTRVLILGATLAAMNLAGMTTIAHAQAHNEGKDARRPPTQGQVGEAWHRPQDAPACPTWPAMPGGHRPKAKSESPGATRPTSQLGRQTRAASAAGV